MSNQLVREKLCDGVYFSSVTDSKFKHNRMTIHLITPLRQETVTENAMVPFLLRKGCKSAPDFTRLNRRLCQLYGAALSCDVAKFGGNQVLELSIYGVDNRFTPGMDVVGQCAHLLTEILFEPSLVNGVFNSTDVELERQQLIDAIESLLNDKRSYALSRCREVMCAGDAVAIDKYGDIEKARALSPTQVTDAYLRILETAVVEIIFTGCGDSAAAKAVFADAFAGRVRHPGALMTDYYGIATGNAPKQATDKMDVAQGKLVLGMRAGAPATPKEATATRLMTAIYGGTPNSRLFVYVREKLSLCYYCAARFDRLTGLLFVDSGVEFANREKAQEEILRQLDLLRKGEFTEEEHRAAQLLMQNSLASVTDSLGAVADWYMTQIFNGTQNTPAQESALLSQVTREEIIAAANRVTLDTVYFLTGKEAQENG